MTDMWVPVAACTLPSAEQPLRAAEFDDLFATAVTTVDLFSPTALQLTLAGPAGLADQVHNLTARESACCSFFTFTVTQAPRRVGLRAARPDQVEHFRLDVTVPSAHADVLTAVAQRARDRLEARLAGEGRK